MERLGFKTLHEMGMHLPHSEYQLRLALAMKQGQVQTNSSEEQQHIDETRDLALKKAKTGVISERELPPDAIIK